MMFPFALHHIVVVYPPLAALLKVSAHSSEVTGSTVFCSHQDFGVMVSSFRTRRQCLSFSGRDRPSLGQRSTSGVESPDGLEGIRRAHKLIAGTAASRLLPLGPRTAPHSLFVLCFFQRMYLTMSCFFIRTSPSVSIL